MIPNSEQHIHGDHDTMPSIDDERRDQIRRDVEDEMMGGTDEFREWRHTDDTRHNTDVEDPCDQDAQTDRDDTTGNDGT